MSDDRIKLSDIWSSTQPLYFLVKVYSYRKAGNLSLQQ